MRGVGKECTQRSRLHCRGSYQASPGTFRPEWKSCWSSARSRNSSHRRIHLRTMWSTTLHWHSHSLCDILLDPRQCSLVQCGTTCCRQLAWVMHSPAAQHSQQSEAVLGTPLQNGTLRLWLLTRPGSSSASAGGLLVGWVVGACSESGGATAGRASTAATDLAMVELSCAVGDAPDAAPTCTCSRRQLQ